MLDHVVYCLCKNLSGKKTTTKKYLPEKPIDPHILPKPIINNNKEYERHLCDLFREHPIDDIFLKIEV